MKECRSCGKRASIYLTRIINGQATDLALCEVCAREKGLFDPQSLTFAEKFFPEAFKQKVDELVRELIGQGQEQTKAAQPSRSGDILTTCPACQFKLEDFRRSGRLGCPDCYTVFAAEIAEEQSAADEQSAQATSPQEESPAIRRSKLEQQLKAAIEREDYEKAALLRDQLNDLN